MLCGAASVSLRAASITKSLVAELNGQHKTSRFLCPAATFLLEPSALEWITKSPLGNICRYVLNYVHRWNLSTRLRKNIPQLAVKQNTERSVRWVVQESFSRISCFSRCRGRCKCDPSERSRVCRIVHPWNILPTPSVQKKSLFADSR